MAIANKFIHFNTKAGFLNKLSEYVTYNESANTYTVKEGKQTDWNMFKNYTCFIKDTSEIWTHEQFYGTKEGMPNFSISYSSSSGDYILNLSGVTIKNNTSGICTVSCDPYSILPDISNVLGTYKINDSNLIINAPGDKDGSWYVFTIPVSGLIGNTYLDTYQYFYYTHPVYTKTYSPTEPSDSNPKPLGLNSAVGTSLKYAREDHVHMAPATISGNAGSATKLQTARTISLTGDAIGSAAFDGSKNISIEVGVNNDSHNHSEGSISGIYESKIKWDYLPQVTQQGSSLSPIDTILIPELAANRLAGINNGITYEYSRDNGETWLPYNDTDAALITQKLFNEMHDHTNINPGLALKVGNYQSSDADTLTSNTSWRSRITINFKEAKVYSQLRKFAIYYSVNYGQNSTLSIEGAKLSNPTIFDEFVTDVPIAGWSGWDTININPVTTATQDNHTSYYQFLRITFKFNGISDPTKNQVPAVYWIGAYGGVGWNTVSPVGKGGFPYMIHSGKEVDFDLYKIKSSKLITKNGTANQVVLGTGDLKPISEIQNTATQLTVASGMDAKIILDNTDNEEAVSYISFRKNGTEVTNLGINKTSNNNICINGYKVWHSGNDGSGSGLDADTLDGKQLSEITLSADKITSGTIAVERLPEIPIEKIPAAALERLFVVASEAAAMSASVQEGDVVQVTGNNNKMYFCISETATTFANKFKEFTAGTAASVPWSGITSKPSWIGTNKPTYNGSEIKLTGYTTNNINSITANSTVNSAIAELDKYAISSITDESGLTEGNKYLMQSLETGDNSLSLYTNLGILDTYDQTIVPVNVHDATDRAIEMQDKILVFTVDGEIENGPSFNEDNTTYLDGFGQFTTPPDTKDYPTSLTWTNGTTAGPIGKLAGTGMSTVNFPAIPSASESISGIITTGAQTFAGNKTFNGTINANIIKSTNSHSWMTACNYGNGVINMNQTTEGLSSAVVFQTNTDNHFTLSATNNYLMLGGYKGDERTFSSNTINGHDGGIGIIIDDNSAVTDFSSVYQAKWRFYGYNGNPQGNIKWSIDQDGQFTGTSRYTKNYALTHKTVSSTSTIEAGNSYYIPTEVGFTISTLSGFSESTPDAQIVTGAKITFTASNAMKIQGLADITGNWFIYNLTYMPNGKVAISGAGFTN